MSTDAITALRDLSRHIKESGRSIPADQAIEIADLIGTCLDELSYDQLGDWRKSANSVTHDNGRIFVTVAGQQRELEAMSARIIQKAWNDAMGGLLVHLTNR